MFEPLYPWMQLVGRILFAMPFVVIGMNYLMKMNEMSAYAESRGVPAAKVVIPLSGLAYLVGGVLLILGWHRFIGAGLIFIFVVILSITMHRFWKETEPQAQMNEMVHFLKDVGLAGGALIIATYAGVFWPMSLGG